MVTLPVAICSPEGCVVNDRLAVWGSRRTDLLDYCRPSESVAVIVT